MTSINIESKETLTREEQINLAGLETEAEQPLEIERQYLIKEDAPKQTLVEEKPFVRSFFIYGMTGLGLVFLIGIWQLMTPKEAPVKIVESTPNQEKPVEEVPQVDYRGKLALRDQKIQLAQKQQQSTSAEVVTSSQPNTPTSVQPAPQALPQPTTQPRVVRTAPPSRPQPVSRQQPVKVQPKVNPQERWTQLANFGQGVPITSSQMKAEVKRQRAEGRSFRGSLNPHKFPFAVSDSDCIQGDKGEVNPSAFCPLPPALQGGSLGQIAKNQTSATRATFVNNIAKKSTTITANVSSPGSLGILNRQPVEQTVRNNYQIAYGTTVTAFVSIPLLWDESVSVASQPNKRFALVLTEDLLASNGKVALEKGSMVVAESSSVNPDNRLVNASAVAIVYKDKQGRIEQRSLPTQKLTILGKQQQPLIAKGHFDRRRNHVKTDLLVSSLSGLGKVGKVFTQPNTTSSVVSGSFGSSVTTTVNNRNREVWSAVLDGFFNPLAERISEREFRQEAELEKLPDIAVLEVGTEVSIIANDTFVID